MRQTVMRKVRARKFKAHECKNLLPAGGSVVLAVSGAHFLGGARFLLTDRVAGGVELRVPALTMSSRDPRAIVQTSGAAC